MIPITCFSRESLGIYREVYPKDYKNILIPTIDAITSVSVVKRITYKESLRFCLSQLNTTDLKMRFQAAYALLNETLTMNNDELKTIQDELEGYKKQLHSLATARFTRSDRADLHKFYQDKIALLQKREQEIISDIEVTATIITDGVSSRNNTDKTVD